MMEGEPIHEQIHPYLQIWLWCCTYGTVSMAGIRTPLLPGPGSLLDQDAELMYAFDLFLEAERDYKRTESERAEQQKKAAELLPTTLIG